jgi:hypothetical protein
MLTNLTIAHSAYPIPSINNDIDRIPLTHGD